MNTPRFLFSLTALSLLTTAACHDPSGMMSPADGATTSATDMMDKRDAQDPNAPGLVRYSYVCGAMPEKTVELPHVRFGAAYNCTFESDYFHITVTDDRVPVTFNLGVPGYHGPGTYTDIAYQYNLAGSAVCRWSAVEVSDKNCPLLWQSNITPCCSTQEQRAKAVTCTIVVAEHSLTRVSGTFDCLLHGEKPPEDTSLYCPPTGTARVYGSYDFGPKDCVRP